MIQLASVASPLPSPCSEKAGDNDDADIFLRLAGSLLRPGQVEALHALVVADHGLEVVRRLIRRGCLAATSTRPAARPEAAAYDLACFPDITLETDLERLIRHARRAMRPGGRLIARMSFDSSGGTTRGLARRLKLNGFINVRTMVLSRHALLRADLPAPGAASNQPSNRAATAGRAIQLPDLRPAAVRKAIAVAACGRSS